VKFRGGCNSSSVTAPRDDHFFEHDVFARAVAAVTRYTCDRRYDFLAFDDFAENAVLAVEKWRLLMGKTGSCRGSNLLLSDLSSDRLYPIPNCALIP
jgi:hypothetical protein